MTIVDVDAEAWARNPYVVAAPALHSIVSEGAYQRGLKLPVTRDGAACLARHQVYAAAKYEPVFAAADLPDAIPSADPLRDGLFFAGSANHWHFLLDGLALLRPVEDRTPRTVYVDQELSDEQVDFMLRFAASAGFSGIRGAARLDGDWHRFANGLFHCRRRFTERVRWIREVLRVEASPPARDKRLFVLRNGAQSRRLLNQDAIAALLASRWGFEVVDPAALSLVDQVRAFRDARVVVGPHGAGLVNTVFAARPALLVEIFHSEPQIFYHSLCFALQARHHAIAGTPVPEGADGPARPDNADYRADEETVARALAPLLADAGPA